VCSTWNAVLCSSRFWGQVIAVSNPQQIWGEAKKKKYIKSSLVYSYHYFFFLFLKLLACCPAPEAGQGLPHPGDAGTRCPPSKNGWENKAKFHPLVQKPFLGSRGAEDSAAQAGFTIPGLCLLLPPPRCTKREPRWLPAPWEDHTAPPPVIRDPHYWHNGVQGFNATSSLSALTGEMWLQQKLKEKVKALPPRHQRLCDRLAEDAGATKPFIPLPSNECQPRLPNYSCTTLPQSCY